jgi:hypothetical protein
MNQNLHNMKLIIELKDESNDFSTIIPFISCIQYWWMELFLIFVVTQICNSYIKIIVVISMSIISINIFSATGYIFTQINSFIFINYITQKIYVYNQFYHDYLIIDFSFQ